MRVLLRMAALAIAALMIATSCSKDDNPTDPGGSGMLLSPRIGMVLEYEEKVERPPISFSETEYRRETITGDTTIEGEKFFAFSVAEYEDREFTVPSEWGEYTVFRSFRPNGMFTYDEFSGDTEHTLKFPMSVGDKHFVPDAFGDEMDLELECIAVGKRVTVQGKNYTVTELKGEVSASVDIGVGFPVRINSTITVWLAAESGIVRFHVENVIEATGTVAETFTTELMNIR